MHPLSLPMAAVVLAFAGTPVLGRSPAAGTCGVNGGVYLNQQTFASHCAQLGISMQSAWNFQPHDLTAGGSATLNDLLSISTHGSNANDPWSNGPANTWPAALCNVQFSANTTPNGSLTPRGAGGLTFSTSEGGSRDCWLMPTVDADSLSIVCEAPNATRCQAISLDIAGPGFKRIRVYLNWDGVINSGDVVVNVPNGEHLFVGFINSRIVRVDIYSLDSPELLYAVSLGHRPACPSCAGNGNIDVADLLGVITHWGEVNRPCDFNGDGIGVGDLLNVIAHWNQSCSPDCPGANPSVGNCQTSTDCGPGICDTSHCTPSSCICVDGVWFCTTDCCGRCI